MPIEPTTTYSPNTGILMPFIVPEDAITLAMRVQANQVIPKGTLVGKVTTAVNAVQTITISGTPTGGTFKLKYGGFTTAAIAHNANSATVQAALELLPSIGAGNVTCSGGAFPGTPVVCTFTGTLAGRPVSAITAPTDGLAFTGGTAPAIAIAQTTVGQVAGGIKAWTGSLLAAPAAPTVSAVSGGTTFGDGTNATTGLVQVTFYNAYGETTPSPAVEVEFTSANRTIRVGAYSSVDSDIAGARYYLNGARVAQTAVSGGNIPQTDISTITGSGVVPDVNTFFDSSDGTGTPVGISRLDISSDAVGGVSYSSDSTMLESGATLPDAPIYIQGYFRMGDLAGITAANGPQLPRFGRFISGVDYTDAEAVYRFGNL